MCAVALASAWLLHYALGSAARSQSVARWLGQGESGTARLAQPAERKALNLVVVGSSPTVGAFWPPARVTRTSKASAKQILPVGLEPTTYGS